jgi:E3 ubiquitin-protein ligase HERC2
LAWNSLSGQVFSWGSNEWGKLGSNSTENQPQAHPIESFREAAEYGIRVLDMSCGESHSLAILQSVNITEDETHEISRNLFVWGCGLSCQLGIDDNSLDMVIVPSQIEIDTFNISSLKTVHAKHNYSSVLTEFGEVYTWGSGEFGRLGYKALKKQQKVPKKIDMHWKLCKLSLGMYHVAGITWEGKIVTWGSGVSGQLGRGKVINEGQVGLLENFIGEEIFVDVSCGEKHTIC